MFGASCANGSACRRAGYEWRHAEPRSCRRRLEDVEPINGQGNAYAVPLTRMSWELVVAPAAERLLA